MEIRNSGWRARIRTRVRGAKVPCAAAAPLAIPARRIIAFTRACDNAFTFWAALLFAVVRALCYDSY